MATLIQIFIVIPVLGFMISLLLPEKNEKLISWTAFSIVGIHLFSFIGFVVYWLTQGHLAFDVNSFVLFKTEGYEFYLSFYFDKITVVYVLVSALLTFFVSIFSKTYLHREKGYKRFFNTILFFYTGLNFIIFSGNFETLFIGWEILGISSFLLIAFYRDRFLPVKNAVKVFSIYRIGDVGLILAMWASHHLWHENISFLKLSNTELVHEQMQHHTLLGIFISLMVLIAAAAKSAQLPFSSWLPRAMEGPTPSSAIFYGSLSVHIGVFLLLRTHPFWEHLPLVRIIVASLGLLTSIIASGISKVQSTVKSQIAYSSIAQIGLMFIEIAAGFETLALIHFAGNAFLRTYQLLVSPSVLNYLIHEQFYNFVPRVQSHSIPKKIEYSLYMLCLKEWNLGTFMNRLYWNPLKQAGNKINFLTVKLVIVFFIPFYLIGLFCVHNKPMISITVQEYLPYIFSFIGLLMVLKSFTERKEVMLSWTLIIMNHFWVALAISFNEDFRFNEIYIYLSGVIVAGILGFLCLNKLKSLENNIDLDQFRGHSYEHPKIALLFLLTCLGLAGFPITATFVGVDLIFSHISEHQILLAFFVSLSFIVTGLSVIRIYARVFLGPHVKSYHEKAYKSS